MDLTDDSRMRQDPRHKIILSVDLGKQQDFTALKWRSPTLLVDAGGVGDAVADTLSKTMGLKHIRYRLVRGTAATNKHTSRDYTVPRTVMFQQLYAAFTTNRIKVDPRLRLAQGLIAELRGLQVERNEETGYERVVHREGEHDDMAICVASTNWWVNLPQPGRTRFLGPDHPTVAKLLGLPQEKRHISTEDSPHRAFRLPTRLPTGKRWSAS
jgi:hypothetical protein